MCYSIYLLHYAFLHLIVRGTAFLRTGYGYGYDLMLQMLVCLPVVLVVSGIFYILIEKPCMNKYWPQHLTQWLKVRFRLA
jgi:peptidoglycan/LPS O-acetylase OafA/YrhL